MPFDNNDRADRARRALNAYIDAEPLGSRYDEEEIEAQVTDLIGDLLHLVRRDGDEKQWTNGEITSLLTRAQNTFEEEEDEEADDEETDDFELCDCGRQLAECSTYVDGTDNHQDR